jgi:hypothetical protein
MNKNSKDRDLHVRNYKRRDKESQDKLLGKEDRDPSIIKRDSRLHRPQVDCYMNKNFKDRGLQILKCKREGNSGRAQDIDNRRP